ncbi:MAG: NADP-dependent oxidoreductase [Chitinophagia bacterium]|nr:NADP-dependent oxidoreductase [Chitinophagia bacterium]
MVNIRYVLACRPEGEATESHFRMEAVAVTQPNEGEVLVKVHYISLDPAMRGWMNAGTTYVKGVEIGMVMRAFGAGEVVVSQHPNFRPGQMVTGLLGVQTYAVEKGTHLTLVDTSVAPLSWYLGLLGMPGLTAYFGLLDKGYPREGETVLVSAAAGMVGSLVGQIAKIKGCKVVGIAGGETKCNYLLNELGFDMAIDYKANSKIDSLLQEKIPNGVDIFFDNVGGPILDAALTCLARGCRIVICGAISQYNQSKPYGPHNYLKILTARGSLTGIIVIDYYPRAAEAISEISAWVKAGKIKYREHIISGIEQFPQALHALFTGENHGKLLIQTLHS